MTLDATRYLDAISLHDFVHAASDEPVRPEEAEATLAAAVRDGDEEAADRLIRLHLRDVVDEAIRYRGEVGTRTLIRHGVGSLVRAAYRYEPERDGPFAPYVRACVRQDIRAASFSPA